MSKSRQDYKVAIICAIEYEMTAVRCMLDKEHPRHRLQHGDPNMYILGELSGHNVVIACLQGSQGKGAAAVVATNLARSFTAIEWRLLVGIAGGVPSVKHDIHLGDVVISMPEGQHGGVVQYDLGKDNEEDFTLKGFLWPPPSILRAATQSMRSDHRMTRGSVADFLDQFQEREMSEYERPSAESDIFFDPTYPHLSSGSYKDCDLDKISPRKPRQSAVPKVHYGLIASGDRVLKSATKRSAIVREVGDILCFEMEAAGIATEFSCIVIRGISDYADSHKNDEWHYYAAAAAAGCAKELLSYLDPVKPLTASAPEDKGAQQQGIEPQSDQSTHTFWGTGIMNSGNGSFSARNIHVNDRRL